MDNTSNIKPSINDIKGEELNINRNKGPLPKNY